MKKVETAKQENEEEVSTPKMHEKVREDIYDDADLKIALIEAIES